MNERKELDGAGVAQADRRALADVYMEKSPNYAAGILLGDLDDTPLLQAFTRHRLLAENQAWEDARELMRGTNADLCKGGAKQAYTVIYVAMTNAVNNPKLRTFAGRVQDYRDRAKAQIESGASKENVALDSDLAAATTPPEPVDELGEGRLWHCNCCRTEFQHVGNLRPNCPTCKAWDQYTYQGPVTPMAKDGARRIPTSREINALPEHIRHYIAWIETEADPSGTLRSDQYLRCDLVPALEAALTAQRGLTLAKPEHFRWGMDQLLRKKSGSQWHGKVVGFYQTELTPEGYAVESEAEKGSVQIYPAKALEEWDGSKTEQT